MFDRLEKTTSPDMVHIRCPDCQFPCSVAFSILTGDGKIVDLTACPRCHDHVTIKGIAKIDRTAYRFARLHGLPVVNYGKKT